MAILRLLLLTFALICGLVGALTAYLPPLRLPDEQLIGLTLNADAGAIREPGQKARPIVPRNTKLDAEHLATLRAAGVQRVKVKEFALQRWTGVWVFMLGAIGFIAAAVLMRMSALGAPAAAAGAAPAAPPKALVESALRDLDDLSRALERAPREEQRLGLIREHIQRILQSQIAAVIEARGMITSTLGISGYAQFMEPFAAGERALNRAWSAAADNHEPESLASLARARALLAESAGRLA